MGKVFLDMSMSLDGCIAGPNVDVAQPMGEGGQRVHDWMGGDSSQEALDEDEYLKPVGAIVMGRRTFDVGVGPWGENPTFHAPCFVLSQDAGEMIRKRGTSSRRRYGRSSSHRGGHSSSGDSRC
jgi:dihydrofolate reductase